MIIGGIYDDRLLVKPLQSARSLMQHAEYVVCLMRGQKKCSRLIMLTTENFSAICFCLCTMSFLYKRKNTPKNNEEKPLAMIYYPELRAFIWIISCLFFYSHSIVLGGFGEMSSTTRLTPRTSLIILVLILASMSSGMRDQSAVIASTLSTIRKAMTLS